MSKGYLNQPYSWFLNHHSADLGKSILSEVGGVVGGSLGPMLNLIAQGLVTIALLILLLIVDPMLALIVGIVLSASYGLIFKFVSGLLARTGKERLKVNEERYMAMIEAFGAVKEVKVSGLEQTFVMRFAKPALIFARHQASASVIAQLPRFGLEAIAFGGMLLVILYLMAQSGSFANVLPIIALYAFAGYRLMPALQNIYVALTSMRYSGPALEALHKDITSPQSNSEGVKAPTIELNQTIKLKNILYRYPNSNEPAIKDISLSIPAKSKVGLVGATGSGKTTMVDLILGLLHPQKGTLEIDGQVITEQNRRTWQRSIGYVPQQIYLADDSVAGNIAFGIEPRDINYEAVERASKIANLHEFVVNDMSQGYSTKVGERGVRLSEGQRQRIGIARALYKNPKVLILDEATSALDNLTEQAVMEAVHNIGNEITIILIAHRLSTVKEV